jgi:hypothetical protein
MSKIELLGAKAGDISDWNHAWKVVSRLAAARGTTLRQISEHDRSVSIPSSVLDPNPGPGSVAVAPSFAPVAPDQLARDMADIERAAAALRQAEPLEPGAPETESAGEPRAPHSIWPLICIVCIVWLTAVLVVSCAIWAIVLLFG